MEKLMGSELIKEIQLLIAEHGDFPVYIRANDYGWCAGVSFEPRAGNTYKGDVLPAFVIDA